jgi:hypothetical protein
VLSNQSIPFQQPLCPGSGVDLAIRLESCVSCLDSLVYILRSIIRSRSPSLSSSRVLSRRVSDLSLLTASQEEASDDIPTTSKRFLDCASFHSPLTRELSRHISLLFNWWLALDICRQQSSSLHAIVPRKVAPTPWLYQTLSSFSPDSCK